MKLTDTVDLKQVLAAHAEWAQDYYGIKGASLSDERRANLSRAYLSGAYLSGADLSGANLSRAKGFDPDAHRAVFWIIPEVGAFTAWKKLQDGVIAQIEIPAKAKRTSSLQGRKCRAEYVKTVALFKDGKNFVGTGVAIHDGKTKYVVGKITRPDSFDGSPFEMCTNGIHFYVTRQEAEAHR